MCGNSSNKPQHNTVAFYFKQQWVILMSLNFSVRTTTEGIVLKVEMNIGIHQMSTNEIEACLVPLPFTSFSSAMSMVLSSDDITS